MVLLGFIWFFCSLTSLCIAVTLPHFHTVPTQNDPHTYDHTMLSIQCGASNPGTYIFQENTQPLKLCLQPKKLNLNAQHNSTRRDVSLFP